MDVDGADNAPGTQDDDLRLSTDSPCINAGDLAFVALAGENDLDGHARVLCGQVDMGAYEFGIGDENCDRVVDLFDFVAWDSCMAGPEVATIDPNCTSFDFDGDTDVDLADAQVFFLGFTSALASAVCGNGALEPGEECDPPNGSTCDANCQDTTGGALANNLCANPTAIGNGVHTLNTVGATTDGPEEPGQCVIQNYTQVDADVWYCYTGSSTEQVIISLCGSQFDTKMVVYDGCACPTATSQRLACSDDDCGNGTDSRAVINAIDGQQYMIRIGGFEGATGSEGFLTIFPASDPARGVNACNATAGACFAAHDNPGCDMTTACTSTCAVDQFCCDVEWDSVCATKADGIVNGFDACGAANAGSCFDPSPADPVSVGCDNAECCQSVCELDPFCCLTEWDSVCASNGGADCGLFEACENTTASCFAQHASPGCNLKSCCNMICENDPACCGDTGWEDVCVEAANALRLAAQCLP